MIKPYDVHVKLTLKMSRFRVHTLLRNFSYRQYFRHGEIEPNAICLEDNHILCVFFHLFLIFDIFFFRKKPSQIQ